MVGPVSDKFLVRNVRCVQDLVCEADVVLGRPLLTETAHPASGSWADFNLSVSVTDTAGETTVVPSHVRTTRPNSPFVR